MQKSVPLTGHRLRVAFGSWRTSIGHDVAVPFFVAPLSRKEVENDTKMVCTCDVKISTKTKLFFWRGKSNEENTNRVSGMLIVDLYNSNGNHKSCRTLEL